MDGICAKDQLAADTATVCRQNRSNSNPALAYVAGATASKDLLVCEAHCVGPVGEVLVKLHIEFRVHRTAMNGETIRLRKVFELPLIQFPPLDLGIGVRNVGMVAVSLLHLILLDGVTAIILG